MPILAAHDYCFKRASCRHRVRIWRNNGGRGNAGNGATGNAIRLYGWGRLDRNGNGAMFRQRSGNNGQIFSRPEPILPNNSARSSGTVVRATLLGQMERRSPCPIFPCVRASVDHALDRLGCPTTCLGMHPMSPWDVRRAPRRSYAGFFALGHATTSSEPEKWHDGAKNGVKWDGTVTCVAAPLHHEGVSVHSFLPFAHNLP